MPSLLRTAIYTALSGTLPLITASSLSSAKRGLCYVTPKEASDDDYWDSSESDLTWYYNYAATPTSAFNDTKLQFVPMLWGATSDASFYDTVKELIDGGMNITYALGFNEPDGCDDGGSCIDAATAATTWINEIQPLAKLGVKLGAPAVTGATTGFTWLQNFFTACAGNCTPDFIPIHWYGDFEGLASHVGQVNATYENMSMWVTEYGYPDETLAESQEFYNQTSSWFDSLSYITHYSYFGAFRSSVSNVGPNEAMLTQKGELTDIGAWYLGEDATGNVPKGSASQTAVSRGWAVFLAAVVLFCLA